MMKEFVINPLDVLEERRLNFLPPHLEGLSIGHNNIYYRSEQISQWIIENLKGKYFLGSVVKLEDNRLVTHQIVAFEDVRESTIFFLACPFLAKSKA